MKTIFACCLASCALFGCDEPTANSKRVPAARDSAPSAPQVQYTAPQQPAYTQQAPARQFVAPGEPERGPNGGYKAWDPTHGASPDYDPTARASQWRAEENARRQAARVADDQESINSMRLDAAREDHNASSLRGDYEGIQRARREEGILEQERNSLRRQNGR